jgi:hypothetical protein
MLQRSLQSQLNAQPRSDSACGALRTCDTVFCTTRIPQAGASLERWAELGGALTVASSTRRPHRRFFFVASQATLAAHVSRQPTCRHATHACRPLLRGRGGPAGRRAAAAARRQGNHAHRLRLVQQPSAGADHLAAHRRAASGPLRVARCACAARASRAGDTCASTSDLHRGPERFRTAARLAHAHAWRAQATLRTWTTWCSRSTAVLRRCQS